MTVFTFAVCLLFFLAISDLIVGVSNDAVNFLNSAIGSRVASLRTIIIVAALGILVGVTFSSGMMEVARKGIFHPQKFLFPEIIIIFLAVMLTDVILLDFFNTFGLPTSTTVSIVFELLGAAVAVSACKVYNAGHHFTAIIEYINTRQAFIIIFGILLSIVVAFIAGAIVQFISRLIFTFQFRKRIKRYGGIWGAVALTSITFFILIKGIKGSTILPHDALSWIKSHTWTILLISLIFWSVVLQCLSLFTRLNIFKGIVLAGTFALALAFAANDLVNFIGVPLAGYNAYQLAADSVDPLHKTMEALRGKVESNNLFLLAAGIIMVATLWLSKKARSVTKTSIDLSRQDEGIERFESSAIARPIVRMATGIYDFIVKIIPKPLRKKIGERFDMGKIDDTVDHPPFDVIRASVNLMVASAVISLATSQKLPLSTTYVTFMVAMGASLADRAWGRDSAVYRITGVLTVIGGWFFTAITAFTVAMLFAFLIYQFHFIAILGISCLALIIVYRTHSIHTKRVEAEKHLEITNLKKVQDVDYAINTSFSHAGRYIYQVAELVWVGYDGIFHQNLGMLSQGKKELKIIQNIANIIVANTFKTLRLLAKCGIQDSYRYGDTVIAIQSIAENLRDIVLRSFHHIHNNHSGLLAEQINELQRVQNLLVNMLKQAAKALENQNFSNFAQIIANARELEDLAQELDQNQIRRIQDRSSKTRLSILFYGFLADSQQISDNTVRLVNIFRESFETRQKKQKDES